MSDYVKHTVINKEILDEIKVGDFVRINGWKKPMKVVGVSKNYFCMIQKNFGKLYYSVCEKKPWNGIRYNNMVGGMFHCGVDNMIFGYMDFDYKFDDEKQISKYLQAFESGEIELSQRHGTIPIYDLYIK